MSVALAACVLAGCPGSHEHDDAGFGDAEVGDAELDAGVDAFDAGAAAFDAGGCSGACPEARPTAPLAGALLTSRRPVFRWELSAGADAARVQVCRDRDCADPIASFGGATSASPAADLPRGVVFWRLVPERAGFDSPAVSTTRVARIPSVSVGTPAATTGVVLDIDGDGRADLVVSLVTPTFDSELVVFLGSPSGLVEHVRLPLWVIATSDVDGDGFADLLVHNGSSDEVRPGDSVASLGTVRAFPASVVMLAVDVQAAGDVDGDGFADVFIPNEPARIGRGGAMGVQASPLVVPSPPYTQPSFTPLVFSVGDLDGDGLGDLLAYQGCDHGFLGMPVTCATDRSVWALPGGPSGPSVTARWTTVPLGSATPGPAVDSARAVLTAGDLDGDGRLDLVALGTAPTSVLLARDASPTVAAWSALDADPDVVWVGPACDLDGDGAGDAVLTHVYRWGSPPRADQTFVRRGGPSGLRPEVLPLSSATALAVRCLGDDDGDGRSDVAVLLRDAAGSRSVAVYRGLDPSPVQTLSSGLAGASALF